MLDLTKGQKVNLAHTNKGLSEMLVGLGWDANRNSLKNFIKGLFTGDTTMDLDAYAILLKNGELEGNSDIVNYQNLRHKTKAIRHCGDNLTGEGKGDDEQIEINLSALPKEYDKVIIAVDIYSAKRKKQHFGMVENAFVRLVDKNNGEEVCRYSLVKGFDGMTAMVLGELYRNTNNEWEFIAIGQGYANGIEEIKAQYR